MLLKLFKILAVVLLLGAVGAGILGCCVMREFGALPDADEVKKYQKLSYFKQGVFVPPPARMLHWDRTVANMPSGWGRMLFLSPNRPLFELPQVALNHDSFSEPPTDLAAYWLGHSSLIIELEGKRLLVDPVFGNAAPIPLAVMRYVDAPIERDQLPRLDYVLITHDHYDHLEYATMRALRNVDTRFIVPYGVGAHLRYWGIPAERISEIGWGEVYAENGIRIAAEPTVHYSGRKRSERRRALWTSYSLLGKQHRIFVSGDSGYGDHFRAIGDKYGPFDLAFIEIDGWNPRWQANHLFPEEVILTYHDLKAQAMVPVHWGVFDLAWHPWNESITAVAELAEKDGKVKLLTPLMGERITPEMKTKKWW